MGVGVGIVEWDIQELSAQGSSEQGGEQEVDGVFSVPERRQSGEASSRTCVGRTNKKVP